MDIEGLEKTVVALCPDVDRQAVAEFFSRMDQDYFSLYTPSEIGAHIRMSCALHPERPVQLQVTALEEGKFDITIVAFDYFSEFSIICGLLSSFGFDIQAGNIYTFSRKRPEPGQEPPQRRPGFKRPGLPVSSPNKIVDVFRVGLQPGHAFDLAKQEEFERELHILTRLLGDSQFQEARDRLNRYLIEHLEQVRGRFSSLLEPVDMEFDNRLSPRWTVMHVHSKDTPVFLYAVSNALAIRGTYIHKVRIQSIGTEVQDTFYISDRHGRKIEGDREQNVLRMAVAMMKQFTHFLSSAPDPAKAIRYFDQFLDRIREDATDAAAVDFFMGREGLNLLARLFGSSDFLWEDFLRIHFQNLLPILEDLRETELKPGPRALRQRLTTTLAPLTTYDEQKKALNEFKDRETFFIDVKHLVEPQLTLEDFSLALTDLIEVVLDEACAICHQRLVKQYGQPVQDDGTECAFSICGLGKFGGREMGYASDVELLFIYSGAGRTRGGESIENGEYFERLVKELLDFIEVRQEGIFHIDLRLRPYGHAGPLANSIETLMSYYRPGGDAAPFERQALIKLRWVAGDRPLGQRLEAHRDQYVYSGEPWDMTAALHLRARQIRELAGTGGINVKYGPGGLIDIEYGVQYLQILHGHDHAGLRTPSTLQALDHLAELRIISPGEHTDLRAAYIFLRNVIDALRIVRGSAGDLILPEEQSEDFKFLARRLGYHEPDWTAGARRLADDLRRHMGNVNTFFVTRFAPPDRPMARLSL